MPLLDHFHPPLHPHRHWESFQVTWLNTIAETLNRALPECYFAEEHARIKDATEFDITESPLVIAPKSVDARHQFVPPTPPIVVPAAFPDEFEVRVYEAEGGARLVAALELVSPANKDRDTHRRAFATKCAGYLAQGIAVIVIDVVTSRSGNLHADILQFLGRTADIGLPEGTELYAVAYRPIVRDQQAQVEVWPEPLAVGGELPTLPLALNADLCLPIDLESTYTAACSRRRLG
ncbi:MAG: DUF4058 family protein [Planctomycetia bacterium]|nr:DUF4058 family protein [Planctomycetia bacterium]